MRDRNTADLAGCTERRVDTPFGTVRCLAARAAADLPTALLVHGVGAQAQSWAPVLPLLGAVRAIALDLPGHGGSTGALPPTADAGAACVDAVRAALGLDGVFVIGQSLGGAVAQCYARDFAPACRGIVVAHAAAHFAIAGDRIRQVTQDWPAAARDFAARQVSPGAGDALKARARQLVALRDPAVLAHDLRVCNAFDARPWAAGVQLPVLVIAGDGDAGYGPARAGELQALYAGARLAVLRACGHNGVLEQPAAFAAAVDAFVREVGRQPRG